MPSWRSSQSGAIHTAFASKQHQSNHLPFSILIYIPPTMSAQPPPYHDAVKVSPPTQTGANPAISVTRPSASQAPYKDNDGYDTTDDEGEMLHPGMTDNDMKSFDDEHRDLPEGWVRCWDEK